MEPLTFNSSTPPWWTASSIRTTPATSPPHRRRPRSRCAPGPSPAALRVLSKSSARHRGPLPVVASTLRSPRTCRYNPLCPTPMFTWQHRRRAITTRRRQRRLSHRRPASRPARSSATRGNWARESSRSRVRAARGCSRRPCRCCPRCTRPRR
jgi:hypothetical protein